MSEPDEFKSKRHDQEDIDFFYLAIVVSLVVHLAGMLFWNLEKHYQIFPKDLFGFLHHVDPSRLLIEKKDKPKPKPRPVTFRFVDVPYDPAGAKPPKKTNFEGARNSQAANEKPSDRDRGKPNVAGKDENSTKVRDVKPSTGPRVIPRQASLPKPPPPTPPENVVKKPEPPKPKAEPKAPPPPKVVKVAKAKVPKPAPKAPPALKRQPKQTPAPTPKPKMQPVSPMPPGPKRTGRPRSLREAKRLATNTGLVGDKAKMKGGVIKRGKTSLDVLRTAFGEYGEKMYYAMESRWYQLADQRNPLPVGSVVVTFRVHQSGRVSDVRTISTEVNDLHTSICQMAVRDPSPYPRWSTPLLRRFPQGYHDITLTFRYR